MLGAADLLLACPSSQLGCCSAGATLVSCTTCPLPGHRASSSPALYSAGSTPCRTLSARRAAAGPALACAPGLVPSHAPANATASDAFSRWCAPASPSWRRSPPAYASRERATASGVPTAAARDSNASIASAGWSTVNAGTPGLKMPAFSVAISRSVYPSTSMWSYPSDATPQTTGARTQFVASSRPPSPTSTTATSTPASRKILKPGSRGGAEHRWLLAGHAGVAVGVQSSTRTQQSEEAKVGRLATVVACLLFERAQTPPQVTQEGGAIHRLPALKPKRRR